MAGGRIVKGVIFNLFEAFVQDGWGFDAYEGLLRDCTLRTQEPFVGPGTYPDEDLIALVTLACERFEISAPDALRAFGRFSFPRMAAMNPAFVDPSYNAKTFLLSVHGVVHVEVNKLYANAVTPSFRYDDPGPGELSIEYHSERRLCHLMEGLIEGTAKHFGTAIDYRQRRCMHEGAPVCVFVLLFQETAA